MAGEYEIRPTGVSDEQLAAYSRLLTQVFNKTAIFTPEAIAWRYRDNPEGSVIGYDAFAGDELVAHYVTVPLRGEVEGQVARGVLSLNTATRADAQGKGLFPRLAEHTYAAAAAQGFEFVVGVSNANSTYGMTKKLGFQLVTPLEAGFLAASPRHFEKADTSLKLHWSPETMAWRLRAPHGGYRLRRSGELTAILAPTHIPGVHCASFRPAEEVPIDLPRPGLRVPTPLYIGKDPRWRRRLIPIPMALRPSPLNFIYRSLGSFPQAVDASATFDFLDFDPY